MSLGNYPEYNPTPPEQEDSKSNKKSATSWWQSLFGSQDTQTSMYVKSFAKGVLYFALVLIAVGAILVTFRSNDNPKKEVLVLNSNQGEEVLNTPKMFTEDYKSKSDQESSKMANNQSSEDLTNQQVLSPTNNIDSSKNEDIQSEDELADNNDSQDVYKSDNSSINNQLDNISKRVKTVSKKVAHKTVKGANKVTNGANNIANVIKNSSISKSVINTTHKAVNSVSSGVKKLTSNKIPNQALLAKKVWLVNIYSSNSLATAKNKWMEIQKTNGNILSSKKPVFIKANILNKGIFYRIALGKANNNSLPYFTSKIEARQYCDVLNRHHINCFLVKTTVKSIFNNINNKG